MEARSKVLNTPPLTYIFPTNTGTVRVLLPKFTLDDVIGSHTCTA
jgi:hypothetical protein